MKSVFYLLCSILFLHISSVPAFSQIGIGTTTPAPSAALDVRSTGNNKGVLITRLTATQKDAIVNPAEGLLVYQTTAPTGFYYYNGTAWKLMAIQTDIASKVDKVAGKDLSSNDYTTAEKTKLAAITGTNTGDQTTITGNAGTATKLATTRNINGVAFDGSADITIAAAAAAEQLSGTTLKSTVTGSSLTSVGTLGNLTVTNPIAGSVTGNAATATKLAASKNINGVAFDGSADITIATGASAEQLSGTTLKSTVTGSSLTSVGTLENLTVTNPIAGSVTGNAGTATKLATSKNINGVAFDGSADITIATGASAETLSGTTLKSTVTGSSLTSVGTLENLTVTNPIAGSVTGNAGTATKLATSKNINGVAFDGSADITIATGASAETLTGTTIKSTVTGSSLTSVGTLANLTVTNPIAGSVTGNANNVTGIVAIANGGTNSTAVATAGGIGYGTGTAHAYTGAGTSGQLLSSNGSGVPTWIAPSTAVAVRPTTDQYNAAAGQTSFSLSQTPLTNANSKPNVWMFINGVRTNNLAYSVSGTTVTYTPAQNGSYALLLNDRIQFDYAY